jgi:hypothetical protein
MTFVRLSIASFALLVGSSVVSCVGGGGEVQSGGTASGGGGGSTGSTPWEHGCFSTETVCDGKCVQLDQSLEHCGACNNTCVTGADHVGACVEGVCLSSCDVGFVEDQGNCLNFLGAYQPNPNDCFGCGVAHPATGSCGCPAPAKEISLSVESDCPGVPLRAATRLNLCITPGVSPESDFGGAFQVDDIDGQCGATAQCRVGNPMAGDSCACPAGFDTAISLRSIVRLPCGGTETGTVIVLCGNKNVPMRSFGGAYQFDDVAPQCRFGNPYTGDCTCPSGTVDRVYRVMVDGAAGLYGSTIHLCSK